MPTEDGNKSKLSTLNAILVTLVLLYTLASSFYFGYLGKTTEMAWTLVFGLLFLAVLNIGTISRFYVKFFGLEAKIERANKVIEKAYATASQVNELAKVMAAFSINSLATANRFTDGSIAEQHILKQRVEEICKSLEIQDPAIDQANALFFQNHVHDHIGAIHHLARKQNQSKEMEDFFAGLAKNPDFSSAKEIEEHLVSLKVEMTPQLKAALADLDYYITNKKLRRPDAVKSALIE